MARSRRAVSVTFIFSSTPMPVEDREAATPDVPGERGGSENVGDLAEIGPNKRFNNWRGAPANLFVT